MNDDIKEKLCRLHILTQKILAHWPTEDEFAWFRREVVKKKPLPIGREVKEQ